MHSAQIVKGACFEPTDGMQDWLTIERVDRCKERPTRVHYRRGTCGARRHERTADEFLRLFGDWRNTT